MQLAHATMLSSVEGRIEDLLIILPNFANAVGEQEYEKVVDLFEAQGTVYRFLLLETPSRLMFQFDTDRSGGKGSTTPRQDPREVMRNVEDLRPVMDFRSLLLNWNDDLAAIQGGSALMYERWAQDPFVVKTWGDACLLLQPVHTQRMSYHFLPMELAAQQHTRCLIQPCPLYLEGGNILRGMRHVLIGKDLLKINTDYRQALIEQEAPLRYRANVPRHLPFAAAEFALALGVETDALLILGAETSASKYIGTTETRKTSYQPLFHIDLYLTLGGWHDQARTAELAFVACTALTDALLTGTSAGARCQAVHAQWQARFDGTTQQLVEAGYHVVRLPILMIDSHCFSWNNCLVEVDGDFRRVTLASYQVPDFHDTEKLNTALALIETAVAHIYQAHGFEVRWLHEDRFGIFRSVVRQRGGLHCITKVLRRRTTPSDSSPA
jgi:hypothetical protein